MLKHSSRLWPVCTAALADHASGVSLHSLRQSKPFLHSYGTQMQALARLALRVAAHEGRHARQAAPARQLRERGGGQRLQLRARGGRARGAPRHRRATLAHTQQALRGVAGVRRAAC